MLEIGIIICLAISLFFALRNFPKAALASETRSNTIGVPRIEKPKRSFVLFSIFGKFGARFKREKMDQIQSEITKGQESIITPSDINQAKETFDEEDAEIARILLESENCLLGEKLREAEDLALEAISIDKKCSQAYAIMGKVAFLRNSYTDAKEAFKVALKCNDDNGGAYFGLGQISLSQDNYTEGIENLQKATSCDRNNALWYAELGKAYMGVRQFAKATKALKRAASLDIDNKEYKQLASEVENKQRLHSSVYRFKK